MISNLPFSQPLVKLIPELLTELISVSQMYLQTEGKDYHKSKLLEESVTFKFWVPDSLHNHLKVMNFFMYVHTTDEVESRRTSPLSPAKSNSCVTGTSDL